MAPWPSFVSLRTLEEAVEHRARHGPASLPRVANLAVDLRFAHHHRLDARGNAEQVRSRLAIPPHVAEGHSISPESPRQHLPDRGCCLLLSLDEIELGAVARRQQDALTGTRNLTDVLDGVHDLAR